MLTMLVYQFMVYKPATGPAWYCPPQPPVQRSRDKYSPKEMSKKKMKRRRML